MTAYAAWRKGRCRRDHDLTDPANVEVVNGRDRHRRQCVPCRHERERLLRRGKRVAPVSIFPPRTCEWCSGEYHRDTTRTIAEWKKRRYCGEQCRIDALVDATKQRAANRSRGPLSEDELARLRRMVGAA